MSKTHLSFSRADGRAGRIRKTGGYLLNEAARETAHADTRTEMPLPAAFQEAMNTLARANVLMGEKLERALVIMERQDEQLVAQGAAMAR